MVPQISPVKLISLTPTPTLSFCLPLPPVLNADFTVEPYCKAQHDIRVQMIGDHIRAYSRVSDSWKGNMGNTRYAHVEVTDAYRRAATACSKLFGGLDILSLDYLLLEDGSEVCEWDEWNESMG